MGLKLKREEPNVQSALIEERRKESFREHVTKQNRDGAFKKINSLVLSELLRDSCFDDDNNLTCG